MPESEASIVDCCLKRRLDGLGFHLSQGQPVDSKDDNQITPLQLCAAIGWTEGVSTLLSNGADIHLASPFGWTALMQAVRNGHIDIVRILLQAGARISDKNSLGWDVLSLATACKSHKILTMVLKVAKTAELSPALSIACQEGKIGAVKLLLNKNVINTKLPVSDLTPLMVAACNGHTDIVQTLLSCGANPNLFNSSNLTALDMALLNGHGDVAALLSQKTKAGHLTSPSSHNPSYISYFDNHSAKHFGFPASSYQPSTPSCYTPVVNTLSPQVFKFPPSPTCVCSSMNQGLHVPPTLSPCYPTLPFSAYCVSPSVPISPMIPPWMFSHQLWSHKMEPKWKVKGKTSHIKRWWRRLKKRYKKNKEKKKFKVYVTFEGGKEAPSDKQFEALLGSLNLKSLLPLMRSHEIDPETFKHLRVTDLEELGIVDKAIQMALLEKIRNLNGDRLSSNAL